MTLASVAGLHGTELSTIHHLDKPMPVEVQPGILLVAAT